MPHHWATSVLALFFVTLTLGVTVGANAAPIGTDDGIDDWASTRASVLRFEDDQFIERPALDQKTGADTVSSVEHEDPSNGLENARAKAEPYSMQVAGTTDSDVYDWRAIARFRDELSVMSANADDLVLDFVFDVTGILDPADPTGSFAINLLWFEDASTFDVLDGFAITSDEVGAEGEVDTSVTLSTGDPVASGSLLPIHITGILNSSNGAHDFFGTAALTKLVPRDTLGNELGQDQFRITSTASPDSALVNIGTAPVPASTALVTLGLSVLGLVRARKARSMLGGRARVDAAVTQGPHSW
ncbi:hypothetical protein CKO31_02025 [Thiohalocapsa halophila]|uniref:PEP-CTERM sorting domain-containing protein n=1 Tax=Thiohalocapsa halophila TaxID=69359 RepID=A0ABS1CCB4_9GAMM|nr:hypothetical protein [Thiohalocapsa halophila]